LGIPFAKSFEEKSRFCHAAIADPIKNDSPHFDISAKNIAVINTAI